VSLVKRDRKEIPPSRMSQRVAKYSRFFNALSRERQPSLIREMTKILSTASPDLIPLSGGMPNPKLFPFKEMTVQVMDGSPISVSGTKMEQALQYLPTGGLPGLVKQLKSLQVDMHHLDADVWDTTEMVVTAGSQDGLCKCFEVLMENEASVLIEEFVYSGTLSIINPYKPKFHVIKADADGMDPDSLEKVLSQWTPGSQDPTAPKFLYINPTGANPTGTVLSTSRRQRIYDLCSQYDLLILEDDPYFYLQFQPAEARPPSFFSLDTEGRVVRFDSFSKILSSGIRLGFVTGPKPVIERIMLHMQVSVLHASSLSQVLVSNLLEQWGSEGFQNQIKRVEDFYEGRRNTMVVAADKHLKGLCEYSVPLGGMFLWIKVPELTSTWDMIMERAMKQNVMLMPGRAFQADSSAGKCQYLRAAFSIAPEKDFDTAMGRLAQLIRDEIQLNQSHNK